MCLTALIPILGFLINIPITRWHFPVVILGTTVGYLLLVQLTQKNIDKLSTIPVIFGILSILGFALLCNLFNGEMFHDALMYHVAGVIGMLHGWNPLKAIFYDNGAHVVWVNHLPKASWYYSAVLSSFFGAIRYGKSFHMVGALALTLTMLSVFCRTGTGKNLLMRIFVCLVTGLNPIFICEFVCHYNDSILGSVALCLMVTLIAIDLEIFSLKNPFVSSMIVISIALCMNYKYSGLSFAAFFCGAFFLKWLYHDIKQHQFKRTIGFCIYGLLGLVLGVIIGANPYITNAIHGFNVFYPMFGYTPAQHGYYRFTLVDGTPPEWRGIPNIFLFWLSIFSATTIKHAIPKAPWDFHLLSQEMSDASLFSRYGGFGPGFTLVFSLALVCMGIIIANRKLNRESKTLLFANIAIILTGMVLPSTWLTRLYPMAWAVPTFTVLFFLTDDWQSQLKSFFRDALSLSIVLCLVLITYASQVQKYSIANRIYDSIVNRDIGDSCLVQVIRPCFPYAVKYLLAENGCKVHLVDHLPDNEWLLYSFKIKAFNSQEHNPEIESILKRTSQLPPVEDTLAQRNAFSSAWLEKIKGYKLFTDHYQSKDQENAFPSL